MAQIDTFDPKSRGAKAYEALTAELLEREQKTKDGGRKTEAQSPSSVFGRPSGV